MTTPITPSVLNPPKPTNGASSQTQQPVEPKPNAAPVVDERAKLAEEKAQFDKQRQTFAAEHKKLGAKLSEYEQLKKWKAERETADKDREAQERMEALNPIAGLERRFGKDWRTKLTELGVSGVPPADMIAEGLMRIEKRIEERFAERDKADSEELTQSQQRELNEARAGFVEEATGKCEAMMKDYPLFAGLGDAARVASILVQRIEASLNQGKEMSLTQAADALENELFGLVELGVKADKYKAKLQPETKPANVSDASGNVSGDGRTSSTQQSGGTRRTLDNSMTASTSNRAPPRSEEERLQRATEAFNAARARSKA